MGQDSPAFSAFRVMIEKCQNYFKRLFCFEGNALRESSKQDLHPGIALLLQVRFKNLNLRDKKVSPSY
jgi:hypothetical protein